MLGATVNPDAKILQELKKIDQRNEKLLGEIVAHSDKDLTSKREIVRCQESELGNLTADAFRWRTGSDIAIVNAGTLRADLPAGNVGVHVVAPAHRRPFVPAPELDIDAVAARSAWGNARWNRVSRRVETACGDASLLQMASYDVILANIHRNILLEDMPTYERSLRRGGRLLISGFYETDIPVLRERAASLGLSRIGETLREEWACVEFSKK
mgnify:CR=1 FL=1